MRILLLLAAALTLSAQSDTELVKRAALDYVEGIYDAKPEYIERSVLPELSKRGFWFNAKEEKWQELNMSYTRLVELAQVWNKTKKDSSKWPKEVVVFEVQSHTANVKVVAEWGMDYLQLVKSNGTWKIANIAWQSLPVAKKSGS